MRKILIIFLVIFLENCSAKRPCNITTFHGKKYEKSILVSDHSWISTIQYQKTTNYLVYTCVTGSPHWPPVQARYFDLTTGQDHTVTGSINMVRLAIHKNDTVVFGGQNHFGVMRFDEKTKTAVHAVPARNFIDVLTFGKKLYISWVQFKELNYYNDEESRWEIVDDFKDLSITKFLERDNGDIYYVSDDFCYKIKSGSNERLRIHSEKLDVRQIVEDQNGVVYFVGEGKVFIDDNDKLKNIGNLAGVQALAFDVDNNVYFAIERAIGKLIPTNKICQ